MKKSDVNPMLQSFFKDEHIPFCPNSRGFFFIYNGSLNVIETEDDAFIVHGSVHGLKKLNRNIVKFIVNHTGNGTNVTIYGDRQIGNILFTNALKPNDLDTLINSSSVGEEIRRKVSGFFFRVNELQKPIYFRNC